VPLADRCTTVRKGCAAGLITPERPICATCVAACFHGAEIADLAAPAW
jgi:hypothetical protein